jgi:very-short-patch-repair endonuclease
MSKLKYNPEAIQKLINENKTYKEIEAILGIGADVMCKYKRRKLVYDPRTPSDFSKRYYQDHPEARLVRSEASKKAHLANPQNYKHSDETKAKISKARKKHLAAHPEQIPYVLNHKSKGASYPEVYFKECLKVSNYVSEYRVGLYSLDFADINKMIDFEVDGCQHRLDPRIIEHDIKRNQELIKQGWKIIRLNWSEFKKLNDLEKISIINSIKTIEKINSICLTYFGDW